MKERIKIQDTTLIGNWDEVQDYELSKITKKDTDTTKLSGIVIRGYETKFSKVNENGERYEPGCLDEFIQSYFIDNGLNMVVDVQHGWGVDDQVGRVVYLANTVARYEQIRNLLAEGILQGFSKCGWATDYDWETDRDGNDVFVVKKMSIISVSLVTSPANAVTFEAIGETVQNRLEYRNRIKDTHKRKTILKSRQ